MVKNSSYYRHLAAEKCGKISGTLALVYFVYSIISGACSALSSVGIGAIALLLITGPMAYSLAIIDRKVDNEEKVEIGNLFDGFKAFQNSFLIGLLTTIFIMLWSMLFIIPGIVKIFSYSMSYYILLDDPNKTAKQCITESRMLMKGHKGELFCLLFSYIGWFILCGLTLGILSFWVMPKVEQATYQFYKDISGKNEQIEQ